VTLGNVVFVVKDTFLPMRLSVMRLPQSMWVPSMTTLFSISVFRMVMWSPIMAGR
jgi:hypothetical protein